ncbi:hypothetical protein [Aquimarina longa]|uniref:hypothetical protein n=1 Tax=Aquimarina longa TaxID=1080221 RepID=UPI0007840050|nr:hypothetical protein [Aquimarina longa]
MTKNGKATYTQRRTQRGLKQEKPLIISSFKLVSPNPQSSNFLIEYLEEILEFMTEYKALLATY